MLQLNCHRFSQLALWFTPKPEYGTDSITVLWEHVVFLSTFTSLAASVAGYWFTQKYSIRSHFWSDSLHFEKKLPSLMLFFLSYTVSIGWFMLLLSFPFFLLVCFNCFQLFLFPLLLLFSPVVLNFFGLLFFLFSFLLFLFLFQFCICDGHCFSRIKARFSFPFKWRWLWEFQHLAENITGCMHCSVWVIEASDLALSGWITNVCRQDQVQ